MLRIYKQCRFLKNTKKNRFLFHSLAKQRYILFFAIKYLGNLQIMYVDVYYAFLQKLTAFFCNARFPEHW